MAQGQRSLGNLARLTKMTVQVDKSGTKAQVILPGFSYDDFDRTGYPNANTMQRMFSRAIVLLGTRKDWLMNDLYYGKDKKNAIFLRSLQIEAHKPYYDLVHEMHQGTDQYGSFRLFYIEDTLPYVGKTSVIDRMSLVHAETGNVLATDNRINTYVNLETRKAEMIPDDVRAKIAATSNESKPLKIPTIPETPLKVYTQHDINRYTDLDSIGHVNAAVYCKNFMNVASNAILDGFLQGFKHENIGSYRLEKYCAHFHAESNIGDRLLYTIWQDDIDHRSLYCKLDTENGTTVFTGSLKFGDVIE